MLNGTAGLPLHCFCGGNLDFVLEHPSPYAGPKEALARLIHVKLVHAFCTVQSA
jgi:hypothetical protein